MLPAFPAVGQLLGRPGSSRLRKALQGEGMGVGEGEGLKDAVGTRNTPSPPNIHRPGAGTQTLRRVLSTGPGQLLLLIRTASRLYGAWAAQDFSSCRGGKGRGLISPVTMATIHRARLLCGPVYPSLQPPQQPPGASSCYSPHFTVAQRGQEPTQGHGVSSGTVQMRASYARCLSPCPQPELLSSAFLGRSGGGDPHPGAGINHTR